MQVRYIEATTADVRVTVERGVGRDEPVALAEGEGAVLVTGLLPGEPVFVLRARDAQTFPVLTNYAGRVVSLFNAIRGARLLEDLWLWSKWQRDHADIVRDPD